MTTFDMDFAETADKPIVFEQDGRVIANSRDVAVYFGKNHKTVLRNVRTLINRRPKLNQRQFVPVQSKDEKGEFLSAYDMDRDGFTLLAMGFTGPKALEFKLRYIDAFNRMESTLCGELAPGAPGALQWESRAAKNFNAASRLMGEMRRTLGSKLAAEAAPLVLARIGLPGIDPRRASIFKQEELKLSETEAPSAA